MPLFAYECSSCEHTWDVIVIKEWGQLSEPTICPVCQAATIHKLIGSPSIRIDGRRGLRTVPDPKPPLQSYKEEGPRPGCTGGYSDLDEFHPTERKRGKDGNWEWAEKKRQYFT